MENRMTWTEARVLECIGKGRDNAVKRRDLAMLTGFDDRTCRQAIADLSRRGELIVNEGDGRGYYIAVTDDEVQRQYQRETSRAMKILMRRKPYRQYLKEHGRKV